MKKSLWILLLFAKITTINAQFFQGTITYEFQNIWVSEKLKDLQQKNLGYSLFDELNDSKKVCQVDSTYLLVRAYKRDNSMLDITIQTPNEGYLTYGNSSKAQSYDTHPGLRIEEADSKEKTTEKKYILGIECQKYIYSFKKEKTQIEFWLSNHLPFDRKNQTKQFFGYIFQREGLVMEYRLIAEDAINIFQVKEISIHTHDIPLAEQIKALNIRNE